MSIELKPCVQNAHGLWEFFPGETKMLPCMNVDGRWICVNIYGIDKYSLTVEKQSNDEAKITAESVCNSTLATPATTPVNGPIQPNPVPPLKPNSKPYAAVVATNNNLILKPLQPKLNETFEKHKCRMKECQNLCKKEYCAECHRNLPFCIRCNTKKVKFTNSDGCATCYNKHHVKCQYCPNQTVSSDETCLFCTYTADCVCGEQIFGPYPKCRVCHNHEKYGNEQEEEEEEQTDSPVSTEQSCESE